MIVYTGHIVDPIARRIYDAELHISDGKIVDIIETGNLPANAPYYIPGFIDSHVHVESSMMMPAEFARIAVEHGSIGAVCDPHEIANVLGVKGVELMLESAEVAQFHFMFGAPSCVPAVGGNIETSGAVLSADDVAALMSRSDIGFLGEMMNFPGVLNGDASVLAKINASLANGKPVDGHAPGLIGEARDAYRKAGISTDHECTTLEEGRDAVRARMIVQIREGSAAKDYKALAPLIAEAPGSVMLCTDDMHPGDLVRGHIDRIVRYALRDGYNIFDILTAACVVPVQHYNFKSGLLQKGDSADFVCISDLSPDFFVLKTFIKGHKVFSHKGQEETLRVMLQSCQRQIQLLSKYNVMSMFAEPLSESDIADADECEKHIIVASDGSLLTGHEFGRVDESVQKMVVYNRHQSGAKPSVAYIKGFGMKHGAIAQSIAHDCHNIVAIGTSDHMIVECINRVIKMKGGVAVTDGKVMRALSLPIAGLISPLTGHELAFRTTVLHEVAASTGCPLKTPFITLAFMALPVIPSLKLTDKCLLGFTPDGGFSLTK